jgi:hypothetical protein
LWIERGERASFVQSTIYLPSNDVFIEQATDPAPTSRPPGPSSGPVPDAAMLRVATLGLAIHNIPLVREFVPTLGPLTIARFLPPFGYAMVAADDTCVVELLAYMGGAWPPSWTMHVVGRDHELHVTFPPSYVTAGSSRAELRGRDATTVFELERNGYQGQWLALHDVVTNGTAPAIPLAVAVDDIVYALDLADQVDRLLEVSA